MKARREVFINEYINTKNATQSALKAGYSIVSAGITGSRLLKVAYIRERIDSGIKRLQEESTVTRELITQNLLNIAKTADNDNVKRQAWVDLAKINGYINTDIKVTTSVFNQLIDNKEVTT
jgi:phage terminase small subunit